MRPTSKDAVPKFLAYYFRSPLFRKQLSNLGGGTNINNLNQRVMKSFQISIPSPQVQGRIVSCIAAYDDLIESNRRRIDLLEEAARQLYKEWFVRFRFPGHEHVKIIDGVPEGWKQTEIGKLTSFLSRGMTPVYDEEAEYIVINQKCIRNRLLSLNLARRQSKEVPEKKLVRYGDVLINSTGTGTLGRVAQCWQELSRCTVDTHVTIARPKDDVGKLWFGYMMMELESRFEDMGEGATNQKELKKALISIIQVNLPSRSIVSQFDDIVSNHARQISILSEQIDCLIKARDLLLPKLMNGEFAV